MSDWQYYGMGNDNRATMPQRQHDLRSDGVKRAEEILAEPGLYDNSDWFMGGIAPSVFGRTIEGGLRAGGGAAMHAAYGGKGGLSIADNAYDSFRGFGNKLMNNAFGTERKVRSTPSVREVGLPDGTGGIYYNSLPKVFGMNPRVYVNNSRSGLDKALTKRHEFDHYFWDKSGKPMNVDTSLVRADRGRVYNNVRDGYLGNPTEMSARGAEIRHLERRTRNKSKFTDEEFDNVVSLTDDYIPFVRHAKKSAVPVDKIDDAVKKIERMWGKL